MCGIAGFSISPNEDLDVEMMTISLLLDIEHRGQDATGIAWCDEAGDRWFRKNNKRASKFIDGEWHLTDDAKVAIMHTRAATQGAPEFNENNHPIVTNHLVGVHNGIIANDREVTKRFDLPRGAEVDSEVIFRVLEKFDVNKVGRVLEGDAACAWMDTREDDHLLHVAAFGGRPVWIATTVGGSFIFASTLNAVCAAADLCDAEIKDCYDLKDGTKLTVLQGEILVEEQVEEIDSPWYNRTYQSMKHLANGPSKTGVIGYAPAKPQTVVAKTRDYVGLTTKDVVSIPSEDFRGMPFDEMFDPQFDGMGDWTPTPTTGRGTVAEYYTVYGEHTPTDTDDLGIVEIREQVRCTYDGTVDGVYVEAIQYETDFVLVRNGFTHACIDMFDSWGDFIAEWPEAAFTVDAGAGKEGN